MIRFGFGLMLMFSAFALQGPKPIPIHEGRPDFCVNVSGEWKMNCFCSGMTEDTCHKPQPESATCTKVCTPRKCYCHCERRT